MMDEVKIPTQSYGILEQKQVLTDIEEIREQFLTNGYARLDAGLPVKRLPLYKRILTPCHGAISRIMAATS